MVELVKYIVENLVQDKDSVMVQEVEKETETVIEVTVAEQDKGKVIGKNGRIAQSIRAIVKSASSDSGKRYFVEIK